VKTIDELPDEVLLVIFDFYVDIDSFKRKEVEAWQSLVHVCRRWRSVVFGSPRRLNLRLVCQPEMPARDTLDVWPPLPLVVWDSISEEDVGRIVAVLGRTDRVCQIDLDLIYGISPWEVVLAPMQKTFPELTDLVLYSHCPSEIVLSNSFLGGSAPRLRRLRLDGIIFPGLPNLLLSAPHLVEIRLYDIPYFGHFSPDELITALSTSTNLRLLSLEFVSPRSRADPASRCPPSTRSLLPHLNTLHYEGVNEYLDYLVARTDAPCLKNLVINFDEGILDASHFAQFICRTPAFEALEKAHVPLDGAGVMLTSETSGRGELQVKLSCRELGGQLLSLKRFCTSYLPLSALEDLYICEDIHPRPVWADDTEDILWPELLHPFTSVKNLYLSEDILPRIPPALQELVAAEVLPMVQNIYLGGLQPRRPIPEGIEKFIAARQLSGQPITVSTIPLQEKDSMPNWVMDIQ
jgi:F-box-like